MKHVYHYSAKREREGCITNYDGILYCDAQVTNMKRYGEVKQAIMGEGVDTYGLVVVSLTHLGQHEVSDRGPTVTLLGASS